MAKKTSIPAVGFTPPTYYPPPSGQLGGPLFRQDNFSRVLEVTDILLPPGASIEDRIHAYLISQNFVKSSTDCDYWVKYSDAGGDSYYLLFNTGAGIINTTPENIVLIGGSSVGQGLTLDDVTNNGNTTYNSIRIRELQLMNGMNISATLAVLSYAGAFGVFTNIVEISLLIRGEIEYTPTDRRDYIQKGWAEDNLGGSANSLQSTTDIGNTTTNDIVVGAPAGIKTVFSDNGFAIYPDGAIIKPNPGPLGAQGPTPPTAGNFRIYTALTDPDALLVNRQFRGSVQRTPANNKDYVQKKYVDSVSGLNRKVVLASQNFVFLNSLGTQYIGTETSLGLTFDSQSDNITFDSLGLVLGARAVLKLRTGPSTANAVIQASGGITLVETGDVVFEVKKTYIVQCECIAVGSTPSIHIHIIKK